MLETFLTPTCGVLSIASHDVPVGSHDLSYANPGLAVGSHDLSYANSAVPLGSHDLSVADAGVPLDSHDLSHGGTGVVNGKPVVPPVVSRPTILTESIINALK